MKQNRSFAWLRTTTFLVAITFSVAVNAQVKSESPKDGKSESPKEKMDTSYVLGGKLPDFQLLYRAVTSPGDITRDQIIALAAWIEKVQMVQLPRKKN